MNENKIAMPEDPFVDMVHQAATARPRRVGYIVTEQDAARLRYYDREAEIEREQAALKGWKDQLLRIAGTAVRVSTCLIFLGGASEGLMDPTFAMMLTGISVAWGTFHFTWGWQRG